MFMVHLTLRMRLDRRDGIGAVVWAADSALPATIDGFYSGARSDRTVERISGNVSPDVHALYGKPHAASSGRHGHGGGGFFFSTGQRRAGGCARKYGAPRLAFAEIASSGEDQKPPSIRRADPYGLRGRQNGAANTVYIPHKDIVAAGFTTFCIITVNKSPPGP